MNPRPGSIDISNKAEAMGLKLATVQAGQIATYLGLLVTYNARMNLVGPTSWQKMFETLVIDSIHLGEFLPELKLPENPLTLDLGAGAGLPGIPLRVLWDKGEYWLVEVRERRCSFMRTALGRMKPANTFVFEGRAEDVLEHIAQQDSDNEGSPQAADLIVSRAFMPREKLLPFVRPMLKDGGTLVVLSNELPPNSGALSDGWTFDKVSEYSAAGSNRYFWSLTA